MMPLPAESLSWVKVWPNQVWYGISVMFVMATMAGMVSSTIEDTSVAMMLPPAVVAAVPSPSFEVVASAEVWLWVTVVSFSGIR